MNIENMTKGADFLMDIPEDKFELVRWSNFLSKTPKPFDGTFECGFAGCAIGWMAHARIFRGLEINGLEPIYYADTTYMGWKAVEVLFDISQEDAELLFHFDSYDPKNPTPNIVAERMRELIAKERGQQT